MLTKRDKEFIERVSSKKPKSALISKENKENRKSKKKKKILNVILVSLLIIPFVLNAVIISLVMRVEQLLNNETITWLLDSENQEKIEQIVEIENLDKASKFLEVYQYRWYIIIGIFVFFLSIIAVILIVNMIKENKGENNE